MMPALPRSIPTRAAGRPPLRLLLLPGLLLASACSDSPEAEVGLELPTIEPHTNIVLILADDLGYCDTGLYGCETVPTPHIASLARDGVVFTDGYVTAATCSPSRAAILTGRYQQRFGFEFNTGSARVTHDTRRGLPTDQTTVAERLRQAGYRTAMIGKWHQGNTEGYHPLERGFDEFFGFLPGARSFFEDQPDGSNAASRRVAPDDPRAGPRPVGDRSPLNALFRGREKVGEAEYLTDAFAREAVAFLKRQGESEDEQPFFLYVPFNAPHQPIEATTEYVERFPDSLEPVTRTYRAMVSALDDGVGRILAALDQQGLRDDTLVVFLSDNGCAKYTEACSNDPLREGKLFLFEGGVRVPFAARLPGRIESGSIYRQPVSSLDLVPTFLSLAGLSTDAEAPALDALDGVDLLPFLEAGAPGAPHETLYFRNGPNRAARSSQWKLFFNDDKDWLFDLTDDDAELHDLAADRPEVVRELKQQFEAWQQGLAEPSWPSRSGPSRQIDGVTVEVHI